MGKSKGLTTDMKLETVKRLYEKRKLKLEIDSVDAPIANYYIYILMKCGKTADEGFYYMDRKEDMILSNGIMELALIILDKVLFKRYPVSKNHFKMALDRTGLCGDNNIIDLRFINVKILINVVEHFRQRIYGVNT